MPVDDPAVGRRLIPRLQFRCLVRLPGTFLPRDGIIDTGSPFTWFPEAIWNGFQPGVDFEELPFESSYTPPRGQSAGWTFAFRMARMLQPLVLFNLHSATELERHGVIVQLAAGNPPIPPGSKQPARVVIGLWGGVLEGTNLRVSTDAGTGHALGSLEW
jgi:hypothetical protein